MQAIETKSVSDDQVNYDGAPIAELSLGGVDYRIDTGHGSVLAVSHRPTGSWSYQVLVEGRWDGSRLKAKGLGHELKTALAEVLAEAMRNQESFD